MEKLTPQKRLQTIQLYNENQRSARNDFRAHRATLCVVYHRPAVFRLTIAITVRKLSNYTLLDDSRPNRQYCSCSG